MAWGNRGFTLLEILIVISILVIISSIGVGSYLNYARNIEINSVTQNVIFDLKQTQSKAMTGEGSFKWGVHFVNSTRDYYEIFSTPTDYSDVSKVTTATNYLSSSISFSNPAEGFTKDIIFNKISGGTVATSIVLSSQYNTSTISISSIGNISVQ